MSANFVGTIFYGIESIRRKRPAKSDLVIGSIRMKEVLGKHGDERKRIEATDKKGVHST